MAKLVSQDAGVEEFCEVPGAVEEPVAPVAVPRSLVIVATF